ncbi:MAG TPA: O-antigen ligase family protein [Gaiellaceae bacterium]|nr:O-antigen ligase family protein [Gaiellaceae bacterium]
MTPGPVGRVRRLATGDAFGAVVLAAAIPVLFVHERYQPTLVIDAASTSIDVRLSDAAVLAVVAAALAAARGGLGRLGAARILWITGSVFLAWLAFQAVRPAALADERFDDHLVTYLKLVEYTLLAAAVPLLVRRARDLAIVLASLVLWGTLASGIALAQFLGWDAFDAWNPGWRQPSFLGHHDLAALAAIGTSLAAAGIVAGRRRMPIPELFSIALAGGAVGLVLAGSVAAAAGLIAGAILVVVAARARFAPTRRQTLAVAALVVAIAAGVATVRDSDLGNFLRFLGLRGDAPAAGVESYSQRTVLAYIGLRVFADNPVAGVGWQRSSRPEVFEPYVDDARQRFPDVVAIAFPAEGREWGVQNLYVQMLADAGVIGLVLLLSVGAAGVILAVRTTRHAPHAWAAGGGLVALCALMILAGEWASLGIVAGIPLQAVTCLVLGLAAAGAAVVEEESDV